MAALGWLLNLGFAAGESEAPVVVEEETQPTGGWPSYGYRSRKRKKPEEEIEERIEAQESEIEDIQERLAKERAEQERIESKARQNKRDREYLTNLKSAIAKDMQVIEEMRRIHDELMTFRYLEQAEDRKRRKRNQLIVLMMEA